MTRGKKLVLLLLALAVLLAAAVAATRLNREEAEPEEEATVIYELEESALNNLTWTYQGETMSFDYKDGAWTYTGDETFPVDSSLLDQMKYTLMGLTAVTSIENPGDLATYGLEEAAVTVSVNGEMVLAISEAANLDGNLYLADKEGRVYLVSTGVLDAFSYGLYDLVETEDVPSLSDVTELSLQTGEETRVYTLQPADDEEESEDTWLLDGEVQDTDRVSELISAVTGVTWNTCVCYNATEGELEAYGLTAPTVRASVQGTVDEEQQTFTLELGGLTEDETGCYARIAGSAMVYTVDAAVLETLLTG